MINKKILGLSLAAATALSIAPAMADTKTEELEKRIERLEKGHGGGSRHVHTDGNGVVKLAGQVHRAMSWARNGRHRDGGKSRWTSMDNDNSPSMLNLDAAHRWGCYTIGAEFELGFKENNSNNPGPTFANNDGGNDFDWRKVDARFESQYATLRLGKGNMVSQDTSEIDLSGTGVAAYGSAVNWMAGSLPLNRGLAGADAPVVSGIWDSYDGHGRANRVALESNPAMAGGFSLGVGHATRERSDVGLKFAGDFGDFKVQAAVAGLLSGHGENSRFGNATPALGRFGHYRQVNGSFSVLHKTGISVTAAGAHRHYRKTRSGDALTKDPHMWFTKLGYQFKAMECGNSAIALNYGQNKHSNVDRDKTKTYGLAIVQHIDKAGTEVYLASQAFKHKFNTTGQRDPKTIYAFVGGARIRI